MTRPTPHEKTGKWAPGVIYPDNGGNRGPGEHTAACCGARFGGLNTAHCSGCHQTFTGMTAFDRHRDGSHTTGRTCRTPDDVDLIDAGRSYPCWGSPAAENNWYANESSGA